MKKYNTIIFDLGAVLIDWDPRYLYRKIFDTEEEVERFLATVCTFEWNEEQDAGRPLAEATEWLLARHPGYEKAIRAYYGRWKEMLGGDIEESVAILKRLKDSGKYRLYALTNWSAETFPVALEQFAFLHWFDGVVVSGEEKTRKPFPEIYQTLLKRFRVDPSGAFFIDDNIRNVEGARDCGIDAIQFHSPADLEAALKSRGILE